ncbi:MAG: acyl--CoA ligase [Desulfobacterales bacterium]|nr:acyl--CoA ligase [Desulfobacterales bacterium]MCP4163585.1 acyl--CoA ligase [Deltaproteobacteria bacterium]
MFITDILSDNAEKFGNDVALVERDAVSNQRFEITWEEFDKTSNKLANALISQGVSKGKSVIQLMTNCIEWLPIYFGILRSGSWVVPLNFRFSSMKINLCSETSEAEVIIFGEEFIDRIEEIKGDLDRFVKHYIFVGNPDKKPDYATDINEFIKKFPEINPDIPMKKEEGAALYFTSGTTGTPKAVLLSHESLGFAAEVEYQHHGQTKNDNFLCIPPLYHTGAKMHWFGNFMVGATTVILKGVNPKLILEAVSEENITIVWLLVPWAHDILVAIEDNEINLNDYKLDQWRLMHIGAQPVPPSLINKWKKVFPHHSYDTNYGLTEASGPGCVHLGVENTHKVGAIGKAGYGWEAKVIDGSFNELPGGETGELVIKGPGVMMEYYKNPEVTDETIKNGWLYTGDMARTDESGFIWLVDRKKDVIITGGENIFPVEIEDYYMENEKIHDIAVIGIPDTRLGEIVVAIVKPKNGRTLTEDDILKFGENLPRYKKPKKVFFDDVPRNPTGKIEKPKLRRKYCGEPDKNVLFK